MTRRVVTTRDADADIENAVAHYVEEGSPDAAVRLVDAFVSATALLAEHPSIGSSRFAVETGIAELRSLALQRFPFVVFYSDDPDAVRIHRVLHASRDIPAELGGS